MDYGCVKIYITDLVLIKIYAFIWQVYIELIKSEAFIFVIHYF